MTKQVLSRCGPQVLLILILAGCDRPEVPLSSTSADNSNSQGAAASAATGTVAQVLAAAESFAPVDTTIPLTAVSTCNFEQINGQSFTTAPINVAAGSDFVAVGFAFSEVGKVVPPELRLRAISADGQSAWEASVTGRLDRADVPAYFNIGDWAFRSGFEQLVSSKGLAPGSYRLVLTFEDAGKNFACDNGRQIVIAP